MFEILTKRENNILALAFFSSEYYTFLKNDLAINYLKQIK